MRLSCSSALVAGAVFASTVSAQQGQQPQQAPASQALRATAIRAEVAPIVDGKDDDAVWKKAPAQSDFLEFQPTEGRTPRFKTEFRAAYDDRNLYFFVRAYDPHPDSIMSALTRRDVRGSADQLKVIIDSYNDRRSGFEFAVSPSGVKRDYAMYNDSQEDQTWDGIWDVGTKIDSLGWTAEFRIPFSQLRYPNIKDHVFG
ncbi:MAG: carbohydrate binding family 9 domain-containing protein, partial [Gemmatimonadales bacterium]